MNISECLTYVTVSIKHMLDIERDEQPSSMKATNNINTSNFNCELKQIMEDMACSTLVCCLVEPLWFSWSQTILSILIGYCTFTSDLPSSHEWLAVSQRFSACFYNISTSHAYYLQNLLAWYKKWTKTWVTFFQKTCFKCVASKPSPCSLPLEMNTP